MAARILELLQLADSCFPSGGFAFSNGLESLAKLGHLRSLPDFEEYLECYLEQAASADLPFLNSAWTLWGGPGFEAAAREWDAWQSLPSQRRASLSQGQAWLRAIEEAHSHAPAVRAVRPWFRDREVPAHFLIVFGATLKASEVTYEDARTLCLHMAIRDQLGAAVRLGLIGSLQAQRLHRASLAAMEGWLASSRDLDHTLSARTSPMIDLGQASHPGLYSKLFQS